MPVVVVSLVLILAALWVTRARAAGKRHRTWLGKVRPPGAGPSTTLLLTDVMSSTALWEALPAQVGGVWVGGGLMGGRVLRGSPGQPSNALSRSVWSPHQPFGGGGSQQPVRDVSCTSRSGQWTKPTWHRIRTWVVKDPSLPFFPVCHSSFTAGHGRQHQAAQRLHPRPPAGLQR